MIVLHVRVVGRDVFDRESRAGGDRTRVEALVDAGEELREVGQCGGACHPRPLGVGGDDVRRVAAVRDEAVDLFAGPEMLAQQSDRHLGDGHRVEGVDPELRRGRRV